VTAEWAEASAQNFAHIHPQRLVAVDGMVQSFTVKNRSLSVPRYVLPFLAVLDFSCATIAMSEKVVFLGYPEYGASGSAINFQGTGFLLNYEQHNYLVTARHVAVLLEDACAVRINK
jgi:hypothetical protein